MKPLAALILSLFALSSMAAKVEKPTHITVGTGQFVPVANNFSANWQKAGLIGIGGIPNRTTQCGAALNPVAGMPSGSSGDNASNINNAIAACTAGQFVLLNAGTSTAITIVSFSGNTMTVSSGTGIAVGNVIACATCQTGTTVTAGSGTSWTVSFGPYPGTTTSNIAGRSIVSYNILQSEQITLNKGITLRGGGTCNGPSAAPPVCDVVINVSNGTIPDWSISNTQSNAQCGVISTSFSGCSAGGSVISVSANGIFNFGWSGCAIGQPVAPTSCGTFLAADVVQGANVVQVVSTTGFSVGQWVLMDELPALGTVTNPAGTTPTTIQASSDFLNTSASPATNRVAAPDNGGGTTYAWNLFPNRVNAELHLVTAVGTSCPGAGCTLTFDSPLTMAFRQSGGHNAQAYWPTGCCSATYTPFLSQAGVENLSVLRGGNGGIGFQFCTQCWAKGVEVGNWINGAVGFGYTTRSQLTHSYLHHCTDCENNGVEYPLSVDAATTECLVDDNVITLGGKGMVGRAGGGGCVIAYNDFGPTFYMQASIGNFWNEMTINGSHYAGAHGFLFEGNEGANCDNDDTHGNNGYDTFFANHCAGIRDTFLDPSNTALTVNDSIGQAYCGSLNCGQGVLTASAVARAAGAMAYNYWHAFVGNVLGTAAVTTTGNGWVYCIDAETGPGQANKGIWAPGWVGGGFNATDANLNCASSPTYLFRNGNYDYVTASIADPAAGFSQSFPNSFYYASKPAFFSAGSCTYPWPWISVHTSPFVFLNTGGAGCGGSGLPAKAREKSGFPMLQP